MKGIISPIGDDLPSIIIIVFALTLFFGSLAFVFNVYGEKMQSIDYLMGAMDIARVVVAYGAVDSLAEAASSATYVATSYGLNYDVCFKDQYGVCSGYTSSASDGGPLCGNKPAFVYDYSVEHNMKLEILSLRVCRL